MEGGKLITAIMEPCDIATLPPYASEQDMAYCIMEDSQGKMNLDSPRYTPAPPPDPHNQNVADAINNAVHDGVVLVLLILAVVLAYVILTRKGGNGRAKKAE